VLRYVAVLNTVFVCYVFSSGMPLLTCIAAVSLLVAFCVDKAAFLYLAQREPASSNVVARHVASLLPYAILLHLGVGVWMLGSVTVFRNALLESLGYSSALAALEARGAIIATQTSILRTGLERLSTPQAIPLVILFAVVLAGLVLHFVLTVLGSLAYAMLDFLVCGNMHKIRGLKSEYDVDTPSYSAAISKELYGTPGGITGVKSYNCLESPSLQRTLGISAAFAAGHKSLAQVADFSSEDSLAASRALAEVDEEEHRFEDEDEREWTADEEEGRAAIETAFAVVNPLTAAAVASSVSAPKQHL
jgi:hypothetical protein